MTETESALPAESQPANPTGGTAPAEAGSGATPQSPAANPTDANADVTDPSTVEGAKPRSLSEVMDAALNGETNPEGKPAEESPTNANAEAGKAESDGGPKQDDPGKPKEEAAENVPFHKHPAWQRQIAKSKTLAGQVEQLTPKAQVVDELISYTGGEQGFQNARELMRTFATDPAAAVPMLETLLDDARGRSGLKLVSQDLTQKVETGELSEPDAIEIEKARAATRAAQQRQSEQQQRQQQEQAQASRQQIVTALDAWEKNVSRDPDYAGIKDLVEAKAALLLQQKIAEAKRPLNSHEMVGVAQASLDAVRQQIGKMLPRPGAIRPGPKPGSSVTASQRPRNLDEAMDAALTG